MYIDTFKRKHVFTKFFKRGILIVFLFSTAVSYSQEKKKVEILQAGYMAANENIVANAQRIIENVLIKHNEILMWCDSAYAYNGTNKIDAFGNVHVNQGDTLHLYANTIYYNGDISFARAVKNVRLESKTTILYTDTLDYDLAANIGYYDDFGKIVDSTNVLTSIVGKYLIDEELIHFYKDVKGYNDGYTLESDTLLYNTATSIIFIEGPTTILDSANTLYAEDGWYNTNTGEAELTKKPEVYNDSQLLKAKYIKYNEKDGYGRALGSVHMHDFENKTIVEGNSAVYSETLETATVTDSAVMILYSESDTLFMHADTLNTIPDSIEGEKLIKAYHGVRFFRTDLQGISDSLVYYTKDSVVQLFYDPVIWSEIHQLSADEIEMKQITDAPDQLLLKNNSFIVSKQDSNRYDQIKGKNMIGYVVNNELDKIDVDGNGETLYYAREENEIIGLNRAESSNISILFREGRIYKIVFYKSPVGELKPMIELTEEEKTLTGFEWKINLRPLSKHDIFGVKIKESEETEELPNPKEEINR